ncbi:MAG: AAA family ATPase, partial [Erythrobacter sp.]
MADADTAPAVEETTVRLQVAAARQEESGQGIARMPRSTFQTLGITEGDVVEITGKRATAAVAMPAYDEDQSLDVIRLDGLQRGNAEVGSGEHVKVTVAESRPAKRVVFAPAQREMRLQGPAQALKRNFFRKPLVAGDLVATTGQQPVQNMPPEVRRMFNAPAYALTQIRLSVVSTTPKGIVHIDENTEVELRAEFEAPRDARAVVNYDDVGGMDETIQQLREMVELPLRYPELFTRLGVDPPKG